MHAAQCRGVNAHAGSCQEQETERNMALVGGPAFTAVRAGAIGLDACAAESLEFRCKLGISKLSAKAPVRGFLSHQAMDICIVEVLLDGKNNNDGRMPMHITPKSVKAPSQPIDIAPKIVKEPSAPVEWEKKTVKDASVPHGMNGKTVKDAAAPTPIPGSEMPHDAASERAAAEAANEAYYAQKQLEAQKRMEEAAELAAKRKADREAKQQQFERSLDEREAAQKRYEANQKERKSNLMQYF